MTFSPRPLLSRASRALAVATILSLGFLSLLAAGCEDKHIGRPCDLFAADAGSSGTGSNATINSQAVECPSRICILPAADKTTTVGPLCTADCSNDDDCSDGETGAKMTVRCNTGFSCMVPTTVGDFCCRKMCVCKDFLEIPKDGYKTPEVCKAGQSMCKNVN